MDVTGFSQNYQNEITSIFEEQKKYSKTVKNHDLKKRRQKLQNLLNEIEGLREQIQQALYLDFKKPTVEVDLTELYPVTTEIKHAIKFLPKWMKKEKAPFAIGYANAKSYIIREAKGTCLIISPWNFPFQLALGPVVSAIAAGNTVILKPSEFTPHTSALISSILSKCFDSKEVSVIEGDYTVSSFLTSLPFDHIFFTGSPEIGKKVMSAAAKNLSTVTLELGGKSPCIVDSSANVKEAAQKIAWGKFMNNGQTCVAPDYLLVHKSVESDFKIELKSAISRFYGDLKKLPESKDYARIISDRHFERLESLLNRTIQQGATVLVGNERIPTEKFLSPTVLDNVKADMAIMEEEIFGPILPILSFDSHSDALALINGLPKPLALYIFSRDKKSRNHIMQNTSAGGSCINDCVIQFNHPNLPFGGSNNSGFGSSHGYYGFKAFSHERAVVENNVRFSPIQLMFPPYTKTVKKIVDLTLRWL